VLGMQVTRHEDWKTIAKAGRQTSLNELGAERVTGKQPGFSPVY